MSTDTKGRGEPPGSAWSVLTRDAGGEIVVDLGNRGVFDELVVDEWLHVEQMTERTWWMRVGDASIHVEVGADGRVQVSIARDVY